MTHPRNNCQFDNDDENLHRCCDIEIVDEERKRVADAPPALSSLRLSGRESTEYHVQLPSSESASAKPMLMPAPSDAARPTTQASQVFLVAKAAAKTGANVETEPFIKPARPGCTICNTNSRRLALFSSSRTSGLSSVLLQFGSALDMSGLFGCQIVEQLPDARILGARRGSLVEAPRLHFHGADLGTDLLQP